MKPPYEITSQILNLLTSIAEKVGEVNATHLEKPSPELRKKNRVKTIKASLEIEGNTLSEKQVTAIIEKKRVVGPKKDIMGVVNAIEVYDKLPDFEPNELKSFLKAHKLLMKDLIESPGKLRTEPVGIFNYRKKIPILGTQYAKRPCHPNTRPPSGTRLHSQLAINLLRM